MSVAITSDRRHHQGRCVPVDSVADKGMVEAEADAWIPEASSKYGITLAIKAARSLPARNRCSNAKGHYVLWPDDPGAQRLIGERLKARHGLSASASSHRQPLHPAAHARQHFISCWV